MKINRQIFNATLCAGAIAGGLQAQPPTVAGVAGGIDKNVAFQFFTTGDEPAMPAVRIESMPARAVTGKPFSATEVRRTRQTLGDGTHIDKVDKDKFYRDFDGRTRVERENGASVMISDPANGSIREAMNGKSKVVMLRSGSFTSAIPAERGVVSDRLITLPAPTPDQLHKEILDRKEVVDRGRTEMGFAANAAAGAAFARTMVAPAMPLEKGVSEDLGDQVINGVMARGSRSTITIPEGQIGNDREIKVVSERWFSNDLGVLIKSSNNDPRFGETTFELTDILQGAQDPTLFEMPAPKRP
jgi:hypothetical protein